MSKTEEKELTEVESALLHTLVEHVTSVGLPVLAVAMLELEELYKASGDERAKSTKEALEKAIEGIAKASRKALKTIPGVVMPSPEELKQLIAEAQAEQAFISYLETEVKKEKLH